MSAHYLPTELRRICGHDSRTVADCVTCEAADALEATPRTMSAPATGWREGADTLDRYGPISSLPELHPDRETNLEILLDAMVARLDVARAALGKVSALNVVEPALVEAKRAAVWALEETSPARVLPRSARYDEAAAPSPTDWPSEEAVERAAKAAVEESARRRAGESTAEAWARVIRAALAAAPSPQVESALPHMREDELTAMVRALGYTVAAPGECIDCSYNPGCCDTHDAPAEVLVAIARPEGYEDVAPELVVEDFMATPRGFEWRLVNP